MCFENRTFLISGQTVSYTYLWGITNIINTDNAIIVEFIAYFFLGNEDKIIVVNHIEFDL